MIAFSLSIFDNKYDIWPLVYNNISEQLNYPLQLES